MFLMSSCLSQLCPTTVPVVVPKLSRSGSETRWYSSYLQMVTTLTPWTVFVSIIVSLFSKPRKRATFDFGQPHASAMNRIE